MAHLLAGRCDDASFWAERAMREMPTWIPAHIAAAASHGLAGRPGPARAAAESLRRLSPSFRAAEVMNVFPLCRPEDVARLVDGLLKAGLPA
jgi:hypothetical protein